MRDICSQKSKWVVYGSDLNEIVRNDQDTETTDTVAPDPDLTLEVNHNKTGTDTKQAGTQEVKNYLDTVPTHQI